MGSKLFKTSGACPSAVHNCHGGRTSAEGLVVDGRILGLGVQLDGRLAMGHRKVSFMPPPVCLPRGESRMEYSGEHENDSTAYGYGCQQPVSLGLAQVHAEMSARKG